MLDASVLVALLESGDAHHTRSRELLDDSATEQWAINVLTMAEVLVGPSRTGRLEQALALMDPLELDIRPIQADQAPRLASLRAQTGLKMPDACVLLTALSEKASLITFDERLAIMAGRNGVKVIS